MYSIVGRCVDMYRYTASLSTARMCSVKAGTLLYTVSAHHVVTREGCSLVLVLPGPGKGKLIKTLLVAIFHIERRGGGGINHGAGTRKHGRCFPKHIY